MDAVYSVTLPVRFQDVDAAGIVFFARFADYAHDAYVLFLREIGLPLEGLLKEGDLGMPIVQTSTSFRGPLRFGDQLEVQVRRPEIGETSIKMEYHLCVEGAIRAVVAMTHVAVRFSEMRPLRVPDAWRERLLSR